MFSERAANVVLRARRREYDGWMIVGVVFLSSALSIGASNYAFGLYVDPLEEEFGWTRTAIAGSLSFAAIGGLTGPLLGRFMDGHGARSLLAGAMALLGVSFVMRPLMTELWHLYALSVVQFAAFSGMNVLPAGRLVGLWFPMSRGRVMGFTMMGNNFGGLTVPVLTGFVMAAATWKAASAVTGILAFAIASIAVFAVHERTPDRKDASARANEPPSRKRGISGVTVREAMRSSAFYYLMAATALGSFTYSALLPQISTHLLDQETNNATVVALLALLAAFGMGGKGVFGFLAERLTARRAMMLSLGGQTVFISLIVLYPVGTQLWALVPIYGFFFGAYGVLVTLLIQECFGLRYFGSISGLAGLVGVAPAVIGPLMAGASSDIWGSYGPAFIAVAVMFTTAILLLTRIKPLTWDLAKTPRT